MATIPTSQMQQILVDTPSDSATVVRSPGKALVSWVVDKVKPWEDFRNRGYQRLWGEYWRMWRGKWAEEDRTRKSERAHVIMPAIAQAIEMTVSEVEEAVFSKEVWFDIVDDIQDQEKVDALLARDQLIEDFDKVGVKDQVTEAVLNAAIFGTGIVKVGVHVAFDLKPKRNKETMRMEQDGKERVFVTVESIRPDEFIPDPAGRTIPEMLGAAHKVVKPLHSVLEKIEAGTYREDALDSLMPMQRVENNDIDREVDPQSMVSDGDADQVTVLEYHGKVPLKLLNDLQEAKTELDDLLSQNATPNGRELDGELIEAIVTIANGSVLLRAMANPFTMKDRSIIAFQFEKVPGRFWGRGVVEKGYNPQKALDTEVRMRIDALSYISSPMLGIDAGRISRGFKMEIKPGKMWLTQGNPDEILRPIEIGRLDANTFNQASEMERMVQMATGAFDTATALKQQSASGSNSLSANSMLMGAFVKRAKRSIANVDRNLLQPMIQKAMWRYMQFDPMRYPNDYEFNVKATLGIVAREVEAMQLTQLAGMVPEEFGALVPVLMKGIVEHTSVANKAEIMKAIDGIMNPPPEVVQQKQEMQKLAMETQRAEAMERIMGAKKIEAEIRQILSQARLNLAKADVEPLKQQIEVKKLDIQEQELDQFSIQNQLAFKQLQLKDRELDIKEKEVNKPEPKGG